MLRALLCKALGACVFLHILGFVVGCRNGEPVKPPVHEDAQVNRIMDAVERAERLRGSTGGYDHTAVAKRLADVVEKISDPAVLKKVFYSCESRLRQIPTSQDDLHADRHYGHAQDAVVWRIERLSGTESAKILVDLLRDETLSWDGGGALTIGGAITRRGKDCLPYLLQIPETHKQKKFATELVECIRKGKVFGP